MEFATEYSFAYLSATEIPFFNRPLTMTSHGSSAWAYSNRIDVCDNANRESFLMKGSFVSTAAIHATVGDFSSGPIGWGCFKGLPGAHYYFCRFHKLSDELPKPEEFWNSLPQDNSYTDTWEQLFINGFKHMVTLNITQGGPWPALEGLEAVMIEKVIPQLLRPLETIGCSGKPVLVHGDLWCDELEKWRPERNKFSKRYFNSYHSYVPKSAPEENYDDRNALYCLVIDEMKRLILRYPGGYEEYLGNLF
ncbi:hypothetical protein BDW68DRAFT_187685 [Aspergillus falconensis]